MSERPLEFRVLSPTAILGYGFPESSFLRGLEAEPHCIAVDAGSTDPGPTYLGSGKPFTDRTGVKRDLRYMLKAGVTRKIPVIIGTAGGSGAAPHLAWCREIIEELAREEGLHFRMAIIHSDVDREVVLRELRAGRVTPLPFVPELTEQSLAETSHIVAQIGIEPYFKALDTGADVILAGRSYDPAVFAALPVKLGFDEGLAIHMGKILECAAIAADPGSGADCVLGILRDDHFVLRALSPERRFTRLSTVAHSLYEKSNPTELPGPGGKLDLRGTSFTEHENGEVTVRGSRHVPSDGYFVKLEGARRVGARTVCVAGSRDPVFIANVDSILEAVRSRVDLILERENLQGSMHIHVYGKNGVMGALEPESAVRSHELGLVIETVAPTQAAANTLCSITRSTLLHYGYPGRISTAGNLAFPFSPSDVPAGDVYEFSLYHLMPLADPSDFPVTVQEV